MPSPRFIALLERLTLKVARCLQRESKYSTSTYCSGSYGSYWYEERGLKTVLTMIIAHADEVQVMPLDSGR
eukprot:6181245-Pleurochrysis_carterae.AAC.4